MKVISGGQTGVDQGALEAGLLVGLPIGGWAPKGWRAEGGGKIPLRYRQHMQEHRSSDWAPRTEANIRTCDVTLVLHRDLSRSAGSRLTIQLAQRLNVPCASWPVDTVDPAHVAQWIRNVNPRILNVAGHRESHFPGIQAATTGLLIVVFDLLQDLH